MDVEEQEEAEDQIKDGHLVILNSYIFQRIKYHQ